MPESTKWPAPDLTEVVTEDDEPLDNQFSEKQQRLLTRALYSSWPEGRPFVAMANVGLFFKLSEDPVVPDVLLSLGVSSPEDPAPRENRSYFTYTYGKPPDCVIEVVSNRKGGELTTKMRIYERIRVAYYAVFDPFLTLSKRPLKVFRLVEGHYVEMLNGGSRSSPRRLWLPDIGLGLTLWQGGFEDLDTTWLRWCDAEGQTLPTGEEQAQAAYRQVDAARQETEAARQETEAARHETEAARQETEAARQRARLLEQRLRELGLDVS